MEYFTTKTQCVCLTTKQYTLQNGQNAKKYFELEQAIQCVHVTSKQNTAVYIQMEEYILLQQKHKSKLAEPLLVPLSYCNYLCEERTSSLREVQTSPLHTACSCVNYIILVHQKMSSQTISSIHWNNVHHVHWCVCGTQSPSASHPHLSDSMGREEPFFQSPLIHTTIAVQ